MHCARVATALCFVLACAEPSRPTPPADIPPDHCFAQPGALAWLTSIQESVLIEWTPSGEPSVISIEFEVDEAGALVESRLYPGSEESFGRVALESLRNASPFPPPPDEAGCLVGMRMRASFNSH